MTHYTMNSALSLKLTALLLFVACATATIVLNLERLAAEPAAPAPAATLQALFRH